MRLSGNKFDEAHKIKFTTLNSKILYPEPKKATCLQKTSKYIVINPSSRYKIAFDIFMAAVYMTCYLLDPFICAFHKKVFVISPQMNHVQRLLTYIIIIDMIIEPLTAKHQVHTFNENADDRQTQIRTIGSKRQKKMTIHDNPRF